MSKRIAAVFAASSVLVVLGLGLPAPAFAHGGGGGGHGGGGGSSTLVVTAGDCPAGGVCDLPGGNVGAAYSEVIQAAGGSGPTPYTFRVVSGSVPPGMSVPKIFAAAATNIAGTPTKQGTYAFTVQVTDGAGDTAQVSISLTIGPPLPLVISGQACCGSGDVGTAFLYDLIASGGVQPYTWTVTPGALPPGVTFSTSPSPNFSGTPTTAGTYPITITVTDSTGTTASESGSIVISPAGTPPPPAPLQIVAPGGTSDDVGTVGQSFLETLEASGGVYPYTWTVTNLPPGLSITPGPSQESEISGTPTTAGTYPETITVTDSAGHQASETSGIIIQP
jgi:large repetitive protein